MPESPLVSYAHDNAALAQDYDISSDFQYEHGKRLVAKLHLSAGERVLDVGAGTGRLALHLAELVGSSGEVVAVDPLAERLVLARARATDNLRVIQARAEDLSALPADHFDAAVLTNPVGLAPPHRVNAKRFQQLLDLARFEQILVTPVSVQDRFKDLEHLLRWSPPRSGKMTPLSIAHPGA